MVLLPALNPASSSAIISCAGGLSLFKMIYSLSLLEWLMGLINLVLAELKVAVFTECSNQRLSLGIGQSPDLQIRFQISVKTATMVSPPVELLIYYWGGGG